MIIFLYDATNKILSRVSCYIVDVDIWPKLDSSSISMRAIAITSTLLGLDQKNLFFERCYWLKCNNLELLWGMALTFYSSLVKKLTLKVRKFWALLGVWKLVWGLSASPSPSWIGLIKQQVFQVWGNQHFWKAC